MPTNLHFVLICIAASLLAGAFFWLFCRRSGLLRGLNQRFNLMRELAQDCDERLLALESHAIDYLLSVGASGAKEMTEMKGTLEKVEALLTEVQSLLVAEDFLALDEASILLSYAYERLPEEKRKRARANFPEKDWAEKFEDLLQSVGQKVTAASAQSDSMNLKKKRPKHVSTISSLYQIGIRTVVNQIRAKEAPVRTLLTKKEPPRPPH